MVALEPQAQTLSEFTITNNFTISLTKQGPSNSSILFSLSPVYTHGQSFYIVCMLNAHDWIFTKLTSFMFDCLFTLFADITDLTEKHTSFELGRSGMSQQLIL